MRWNCDAADSGTLEVPMGVNRNTGAYHAERMDSVRGAPQIGGGWELGKKAQRVSDGGTVPDTNGGTSPCGTVSKLSGDQMAQLRNGGVWREECDGSIDAEILATPAIETPQWPFLHTPGDAAAPGCVKIILVVTWWRYDMVLHALGSHVFCKILLERTSTGNHSDTHLADCQISLLPQSAPNPGPAL